MQTKPEELLFTDAQVLNKLEDSLRQMIDEYERQIVLLTGKIEQCNIILGNVRYNRTVTRS